MSQLAQFYVAMRECTPEERETALADALSIVGADALERIILKAPLQQLEMQARVKIAFRLDATLVGHSYRLRNGELRWELPLVPLPLRPVVYTLSHLASQIQSATRGLTTGRGNYALLYPLLSPEQMQSVVEQVRPPLMGYTSRLRAAQGWRERRANTTPAPQSGDSSQDSALKSDKTSLSSSEAMADAKPDETDTAESSVSLEGDAE